MGTKILAESGIKGESDGQVEADSPVIGSYPPLTLQISIAQRNLAATVAARFSKALRSCVVEPAARVSRDGKDSAVDRRIHAPAGSGGIAEFDPFESGICRPPYIPSDILRNLNHLTPPESLALIEVVLPSIPEAHNPPFAESRIGKPDRPNMVLHDRAAENARKFMRRAKVEKLCSVIACEASPRAEPEITASIL